MPSAASNPAFYIPKGTMKYIKKVGCETPNTRNFKAFSTTGERGGFQCIELGLPCFYGDRCCSRTSKLRRRGSSPPLGIAVFNYWNQYHTPRCVTGKSGMGLCGYLSKVTSNPDPSKSVTHRCEAPAIQEGEDPENDIKKIAMEYLIFNKNKTDLLINYLVKYRSEIEAQRNAFIARKGLDGREGKKERDAKLKEQRQVLTEIAQASKEAIKYCIKNRRPMKGELYGTPNSPIEKRCENTVIASPPICTVDTEAQNHPFNVQYYKRKDYKKLNINRFFGKNQVDAVSGLLKDAMSQNMKMMQNMMTQPIV